MQNASPPTATRPLRIVAGLCVALLAAGCTATTGEPQLGLAAPSYAGGAAGADDLAALQAGTQADGEANLTAEGEASLPDQVAYVPVAKPGAGDPALAALAAEEASAPAAPAGQDAAAAPVAAAQPAGTQILENGGPVLTAGTMPPPSIEPKKKSFLSSLFGTSQASAAPASRASAGAAAKAKPIIAVPAPKEVGEDEGEPAVQVASLGGGDALPGVRQTALFEIKRRSGIDDESDVDLHEDEQGAPVQLASAAGMARLAPNGLLKQRETVDVACLKPGLVRVLKTVERHFGKKMLITSGYRSPTYNRKVRGAKKSQHMFCAAADVQIPGVSKWELAQFVRTMPNRGGVGTYCHTESVHIDIGPERDWNWRCRRRKT